LETPANEFADVPAADRRASPCLEAAALECGRDDRILFSGLDFILHPGRALLVEGANGSGKTTLLRAVCGFVRPESGSVRWGGEDIERIRPEYQAEIAYLGHHHGIKDELTAVENLRITRALAGSSGVDEEQALEKVGMLGYEDAMVRTMSAGQRRRVALARLLVVDARLWIMDEPFTALDTRGIAMVEALLEAHCADGGMALLSSHHPVTLSCTTEHPIRLTP